MSHYIYRKKLFAETSNGLLLPFACCSDSSLTVGCGMNEHHPSFWCVMNLGFDYLFPKIEVWEKAVNAEYDRQIALLQEYERDYPSGKPVGSDSLHYSGNKFPGGGKLKNMMSFLSAKNTMPVSEFLRKHSNVIVSLEPIKPGSFLSYEIKEICLSSEQAVLDAEEEYQMFLKEYSDARYICVGVQGL